MEILTTEEQLEIKRARKIALADQQKADHKAAIDKINEGRAAFGLRLLGVQGG